MPEADTWQTIHMAEAGLERVSGLPEVAYSQTRGSTLTNPELV